MAKRSRRGEIRQAFEDAGGLLNTRQFAQHLIDVGFYVESDLYRMQLRAIQGDIRGALNEEGPNGLPFAQPIGPEEDSTEDDEHKLPLWKQLRLFDYDELAALIGRRVTELRFDHDKITRLRDYCAQRFGKAPAVPPLP